MIHITFEKSQKTDKPPKPGHDLLKLNWTFTVFILLGLIAIWVHGCSSTPSVVSDTSQTNGIHLAITNAPTNSVNTAIPPDMCAGSTQKSATATIWAFAFLFIGGFVGLLFGVKREQTVYGNKSNEQSDKSSTANADTKKDDRYLPNNNLIEVSDWLTKIIVGLGLIELRQLPTHMKTITAPLTRCEGGTSGYAIACGIVLFFSFAGFLIGYINSRTFLDAMFRKFDDQRSIDELKKKIEESSGKQEAQQSRVASLQEVALLCKQPASGGASPGGSLNAETEQKNVLDLATAAAEANSIRNFDKRTATKDAAARQIAQAILSGAVTRDWIVEQAERQPLSSQNHEALIAGLALAINAKPEAEDMQRLSKVSHLAVWPNTHRKIAVAIGQLFSTRAAGKADVNTAKRILSEILKKDHEDWTIRSVRATQALIAECTGMNPGLL